MREDAPGGKAGDAHVSDPVCPYCGECPARISAAPVRMGPMVGVTVFCANPACRKIITVAVVGIDQARPPEIVVPRMS